MNTSESAMSEMSAVSGWQNSPALAPRGIDFHASG
jgi:hypothetical protein